MNNKTMTVMGCLTYNYTLESFHDAITRLFLKRVNCKQPCLHFWLFNRRVLFHDNNMSLFFKGRGLSGGLCYHRVVSNVNGYAGLQTAGIIAHETGHK